MRLFFALELPAATALAVAAWRDRQLPVQGRPVPIDNFHITLAFIGEVEPRKQEQLCLAVDQWRGLSTITGASLNLDQTGFWPRPGICWLGPTHWPEQLDLLAGKLCSLGQRVGSRSGNSRFRPHITLFRRCQLPPPAPAVVPTFDFNFAHFTLFESRPTRNSVSYHPLQDWDLS